LDLVCKTVDQKNNESQKVSPCHKEPIDDRDLSPCCKAPIDESKVIKKGIHVGHGPRYCSKCKKFIFLV
jgi:hypothetical protein